MFMVALYMTAASRRPNLHNISTFYTAVYINRALNRKPATKLQPINSRQHVGRPALVRPKFNVEL